MHSAKTSRLKDKIQKIIESSLSPITDFVVLRGNDLLARDKGDIDVLVPNSYCLKACQAFIRLGERDGWRVLYFRNIRYLAQVVLCQALSNEETLAVKVDFFGGLEWYGVGSGKITERLFSKVLSWQSSASEYDAIVGAINFLQKSMTVGRLAKRDVSRAIAYGASPKYIFKTAKTLRLPLNIKEAESGRLTWSKKWRLRFASSSPVNTSSFIFWLIQIIYVHLRFKSRLCTGSGLIISISGLDGSGKSTQFKRLINAYKTGGGPPVKTLHFLPRWIPLPHQMLNRGKTSQNYGRPYSEAPTTSTLSGMSRLAYYFSAFFITKISLSLSAKRGAVIIIDRSFADFAVDPLRARIPFPSLHKGLLRACTLKGCNLFIDVLPETSVSRKDELSFEKATSLRSNYLSIFKTLGGYVVDGDDSEADVFNRILNHIHEIYVSRIVQMVEATIV